MTVHYLKLKVNVLAEKLGLAKMINEDLVHLCLALFVIIICLN